MTTWRRLPLNCLPELGNMLLPSSGIHYSQPAVPRTSTSGTRRQFWPESCDPYRLAALSLPAQSTSLQVCKPNFKVFRGAGWSPNYAGLSGSFGGVVLRGAIFGVVILAV